MAQKHYIPIIDYLKAFAIVLVVTTHFFTYSEKDFPLFIYVIQMGMPLFMFISSYNFAMSAERHGLDTLGALYTPAQMKKHFGGILPAYTLLFVVELVANLWLGERFSLGICSMPTSAAGSMAAATAAISSVFTGSFCFLRRFCTCFCAAGRSRRFWRRSCWTCSMNLL